MSHITDQITNHILESQIVWSPNQITNHVYRNFQYR